MKQALEKCAEMEASVLSGKAEIQSELFFPAFTSFVLSIGL
jgi:hypothetical protein